MRSYGNVQLLRKIVNLCLGHPSSTNGTPLSKSAFSCSLMRIPLTEITYYPKASTTARLVQMHKH